MILDQASVYLVQYGYYFIFLATALENVPSIYFQTAARETCSSLEISSPDTGDEEALKIESPLAFFLLNRSVIIFFIPFSNDPKSNEDKDHQHRYYPTDRSKDGQDGIKILAKEKP